MQTGGMNGFTDIHTHILPCVDDGAQDYSQARELVQMAWEDGTRNIILTPHYRGAYRKNSAAYLRAVFNEFSKLIHREFPDMNLYLGSEIYYQSEVPDRLAARRILSLADSQYVLLEFRTGSLRSHVITGVSETIRCGFAPIIAHAERYEIFRKDSTLTDEVLEMGALIQLNADSVMGEHGFGVKRFCRKLLKAQQAHFIASDAHDSEERPPLLLDCYLHICKKYGEEYAAQLFCENAQAVIENRII